MSITRVGHDTTCARVHEMVPDKSGDTLICPDGKATPKQVSRSLTRLDDALLSYVLWVSSQNYDVPVWQIHHGRIVPAWTQSHTCERIRHAGCQDPGTMHATKNTPCQVWDGT